MRVRMGGGVRVRVCRGECEYHMTATNDCTPLNQVPDTDHNKLLKYQHFKSVG